MWEISLSGQIDAFLCAIVLGALLAVFYNFIRATRDRGLNSFAAVFIGDLIFFIVSAIAVFIYLLGVTNGEIRGYIILSAAIGFFLYRVSIGRAVYFLFCTVLKFSAFAIGRVSSFLIKTVLICEKTVKYIIRLIKPLCECIMPSIKKLLKSIYNMLYTVKDKKKPRYDADEQGR